MVLPFGPPLKPMLARLEPELPRGQGFVYEPKWDGFRTLVFFDGTRAELRSRTDRPLNRYFPEVEEVLCRRLPLASILDGEIVLATPSGLDFDALQLRLHPAASRVELLARTSPASFVAFDLLACEGEDLRSRPLAKRLSVLDALLASHVPTEVAEPATTCGPCLYRTPRTHDFDEASSWFVDLEAFGLDGVVAKRTDLPYAPGERVMVKVKHRRTADCVVIGYRPHVRGGVGSLLLGMWDGDRLRYVGHTSSFSATERRRLLEFLRPLEGPNDLGEWGPGPSRWSGQQAEWVPVRPELVCEVSYDFVQSKARFRHAARFLRWRDDKRPDDCRFDQL